MITYKPGSTIETDFPWQNHQELYVRVETPCVNTLSEYQGPGNSVTGTLRNISDSEKMNVLYAVLVVEIHEAMEWLKVHGVSFNPHQPLNAKLQNELIEAVKQVLLKGWA